MASERRLIDYETARNATCEEVFWSESEQAGVRNFLVKLPRADAVEMPEWISVKDRLPEKGEDVLVFGYWHEKWQPLMCYLSPHRNGEWFTTVAGQQVYEVTHWMPLPELPKGE